MRSTVDGGASGWFPRLGRLIAEESAQDLVEYALITSFIGVAGYLVLMALGFDISATYNSWLDPTPGSGGVPSLWDPPPPSGGS